ncbi:hypothetical protein TcWFU_007649 [Taenia crassiceps]|uniref:Uncharacterized protein n=1 Tax=Taenia crassiceps TaxID=6207 RepID=A0ABR4Q8X6_9CEST
MDRVSVANDGVVHSTVLCRNKLVGSLTAVVCSETLERMKPATDQRIVIIVAPVCLDCKQLPTQRSNVSHL